MEGEVVREEDAVVGSLDEPTAEEEKADEEVEEADEVEEAIDAADEDELAGYATAPARRSSTKDALGPR